MTSWIHRVVQQLSLPFGPTEPLAAPAPSRSKVEPRWNAPVAPATAPRPVRPPAARMPSARPAARAAARPAPFRLRHDPQQGARAVLSGRCADVCAVLERLAAQEAAA